MDSFDYLTQFPTLIKYQNQLDEIVKEVQSTKFVLIVGNGGSETIASHSAIDFLLLGINCTSLSTPAVVTALANDFGYEYIYSKQIEMYPIGDCCVIAISSSGNSKNIVNAASIAKGAGHRVITLSGFKRGNELSSMGDINIHIPVEDYGYIEVTHMAMMHYVINTIKESR